MVVYLFVPIPSHTSTHTWLVNGSFDTYPFDGIFMGEAERP